MVRPMNFLVISLSVYFVSAVPQDAGKSGSDRTDRFQCIQNTDNHFAIMRIADYYQVSNDLMGGDEKGISGLTANVRQ